MLNGSFWRHMKEGLGFHQLGWFFNTNVSRSVLCLLQGLRFHPSKMGRNNG